jgi:hypothetical protein
LRREKWAAASKWNPAVAHQYAVRLALIAFATAAIQGALRQSGFEPALKFALAAAAAFYVLGWLCGELARRIVEESLPGPTPATAPVSPIPQSTGR